MEKRYRRMIKALGEEKPAPGAPAEWSLYIARCNDGTFYTGIAKNVDERLKQHNAGRGAAYTRARKPVRLFYREDGFTRSSALVREAAVKRLSRGEKQALALSQVKA